MQVEYRNGNYIGEFSSQNYHRNGFGILVLDNSQIIMAKWKADLINGPFVIINDRMRVLGTMNNNILQGYNVISFQESLVSNKREKQRTIYGMFRENKLYGKALIIDNQDAIIANYTDGRLREICERRPVRDRAVIDMLSVCFPNEVYSIWDWLTHIFKQTSKSEAAIDSSYKYEPCYRKFQQDLEFFGYSQIFSKNRSFGFTMHQGQVISIGDHEKNYLEGIGRLYHGDGTVEDGVFKNGELCGIGISYSKKTHKFLLGDYNQENQSFEKGFGFPQKQINQIRKQFHLRSINFYNDIVLFSFSTIFQAISANCLQYGPQHESPRFTSINGGSSGPKFRGLPQKSPLRAKITQYSQQSQQIDQSSPIKNKPINEYSLAERGDRHKYFDESEEARKSRSKSKSKNKGRKVQAKSGTRQIKDTRQFVRELDEKQRTRRSYLDQIYKDAKLYNRR